MATTIRDLFYDTTMPWEPDEYIIVNGHPLVYSLEKDGLLVRFPGGSSEMDYRLANAGHVVRHPAKVRRKEGGL